ncbi:MAG: lysozyme [Alphaproteobacteria bacterium]
MKVHAEGLRLIKDFEGLALAAYLDAAGVATIGYGHTAGVKPGDRITAEEADRLLQADLAPVEARLQRLIRVRVSGNAFSALASFAFNIGTGAFAKSTVLKRLNAGDRAGAADAITLWDKARIGGTLVRLPGLTRRRAAERALFLTPDASAADASGRH